MKISLLNTVKNTASVVFRDEYALSVFKPFPFKVFFYKFPFKYVSVHGVSVQVISVQCDKSLFPFKSFPFIVN